MEGVGDLQIMILNHSWVPILQVAAANPIAFVTLRLAVVLGRRALYERQGEKSTPRVTCQFLKNGRWMEDDVPLQLGDFLVNHVKFSGV